jgi:hypothetical protein
MSRQFGTSSTGIQLKRVSKLQSNKAAKSSFHEFEIHFNIDQVMKEFTASLCKP